MISRMPALTVLAIDTATEVCSVAVLAGERLVEHVEVVGQKHSERALPMVDAVLAEAGLGLAEIDVIAFGAGPGSFTGLRIACGIAQGLAYGMDKSVVAVGNLRALAARALAEADADAQRVLVAIDARMHESYCAVYGNDARVTELRAPSLERPDSLAQLAHSEKVGLVAGNALFEFASDWPESAPWQRLPALRASAADVARLARGDAERGLAVPPAQAMPVYVRDHVALTIEERRQRASVP
jgi:tRNA threonylcarbamoyladenosine biosynthesis protein TsaB